MTPGPWRAEKHQHNSGPRWSIETPLGELVDYIPDEETALALAAAPELLEALKKTLTPILQTFEHYQDTENGPAASSTWAVLQKAEAAIKKAQGGFLRL